MIKDALLALNEKSGSSPYAIAKFVEEKQKSVLKANFRKTLALQLKILATKGKLVKIRASYKLASETTKKPRSSTRTRTRARSSSTWAKTMPVNKHEVATKKKVSRTRKAKPRQLKSIKSPAAKKAMRASASSYRRKSFSFLLSDSIFCVSFVTISSSAVLV
ncbi:PREDICTED: histone H1-like isoform X2 [Tarenaya hassleriana]|uniref:histone H1-like isoform X2 n=1 Tax=Tarenaya hassleriana TaxID=28532 RepID=UPI00053C8A96|nr:PREDICTED: histone H1-like isoform X2 [Tarenaya hassleriana]